MNPLKQIREKLQRQPNELAAAAGVSVAAYHDLEAHDDELNYAISVGAVARIARELGVRPSALYGGAPTRTVTVADLAWSVRAHWKQSGSQLEDWEKQIGWSVAAALPDPERFRDFNADGLKAVCSAVDVDWCAVLDGL